MKMKNNQIVKKAVNLIQILLKLVKNIEEEIIVSLKNKKIKNIYMNNSKTQYSLSKINIKKSSNVLNSQRSIKHSITRRKNFSQLSNKRKDDIDHCKQNQTIYQEYYGKIRNDSAQYGNHRQQLQKQQIHSIHQIAKNIQQKMIKAIKQHDQTTQMNYSNVVLEESDAEDAQFQQKIMQNRQLLKMQRQKNNSTSLHTLKLDVKQIKKKKSKKLSLLQGKVQQIIKKTKSKSLFPPIKNVVLKNHQHQKQAKKVKIDQQIKFDDIKHYNKQKSPLKDDIFNQKVNNVNEQRKLSNFKKKTQVVSIHKQSNKKLTELKIQSKITDLKNKLAIRKSTSNLKKQRLSFKQQLKPPNSPRYTNSNSVFDSIQDFLSNPHQNGSRSQRKYLKLHQKVLNPQIQQQQKQKIEQKILKITQQLNELNIRNQINEKKPLQEQIVLKKAQSQQKILKKPQSRQIELKIIQQKQSPQIQQRQKQIQQVQKQLSQQLMQQNQASKQYEPNLKEAQNEQVRKQKHLQQRPTDTSQNNLLEDQQLWDYGSLQWRRLEKDSLKRSDFQKQLKYVTSLQEKNQLILSQYIQYRKILQQLKDNKTTQGKRYEQRKIVSQNKVQDKDNYTSL